MHFDLAFDLTLSEKIEIEIEISEAMGSFNNLNLSSLQNKMK